METYQNSHQNSNRYYLDTIQEKGINLRNVFQSPLARSLAIDIKKELTTMKGRR